MANHITRILTFVIFLLITSTGCKNESSSASSQKSKATFQMRQMNYPLWVRSTSIYEVNIRNYTREGTFAAFQQHLPRLKKMGVTTIALLPIYPISFVKRSGSLGNPRAVADHAKVNPEFGTFEEFHALVGQIHRMNMHLILHWVPNHTGWDHTWITTHPEWYTHRADTITQALDESGQQTGWNDVADLNYEIGPMRNTMIETMKFWLRAADIDGYICDDANLLPDDFWNEVRPALEQIKPVLMIADSEDNPSHFETCFQANYGWHFYEKLNALATGKGNVSALAAVLAKNRSENPAGYYQINVATLPEPDEQDDATETTDGEIKKALAILAFTAEGMPLLYGGEETGETKVVAPSDKSPVDWSNSSMEDFYTKLIQLKNFNKSLWNGKDGGTLERISESDQIYAFIREKDGHRVVVIVNCSDQDATTTLTEDIFSLSALFGKQDLNIPKGTPIKLKGWEYWLFANPSVETN